MLDEEGLATFSLRGLATRLGVHVTSLYQYFPTKDDLLRAIFHHIHEKLEHETDPAAPWQSYLSRSMRSYRRLLIQHPYLPYLSPYSIAEVVAQHVEIELAALTRAGFTAEEAGRAFGTVRTFVVGAAMSEVVGASRGRTRFDPAKADNRASFPNLVEAMPHLRDHEAIFEFGLRSLLLAIEKAHSETCLD